MVRSGGVGDVTGTPRAGAGAAVGNATVVVAAVVALFLCPRKRVWHVVMRSGIHDHVSDPN